MALLATTNSKPVIDARGPAGNAYALLAAARDLSRQVGLETEAILNDMRSGDYRHLLKSFDRHFGEYVDLLVPPEYASKVHDKAAPRARPDSAATLQSHVAHPRP